MDRPLFSSVYCYRTGVLLLIVSMLAGCVSAKTKPHEQVPSEDQGVVQCEQTFPEWELGLEGYSLKECESGSVGEFVVCNIVLGGVILVGSTIVSGSVYAVGNTLHWAEKSVRCSDLPETEDAQEPVLESAAGGDLRAEI